MRKIYFKHFDKRLVNFYYATSDGTQVSAVFQESNRGQLDN